MDKNIGNDNNIAKPTVSAEVKALGIEDPLKEEKYQEILSSIKDKKKPPPTEPPPW